MSRPEDLPPGFDRHADALAIVGGGACNPSGIAPTLIHACRQVLDANTDVADYGALMAACRARAGTAPAS